MSVNPLAHVSSVWSNAATALSTVPTGPGTIPSTKPPAGGKPGGTAPGQGDSIGTPFQKLSSDLQSVLLQMQSGQGQVPVSRGNEGTATGAAGGSLSARA